METILNDIYDLVDTIIKIDPAIYRVMFFDPNGTEIYQFAKMWNKAKQYSSIGAMVGQIFKNSDKFLGFMKRTTKEKFTFQWYFDKVVLFAADTHYGFIALLCEPDVDLGFVKTILVKQALPLYGRIMRPIQD